MLANRHLRSVMLFAGLLAVTTAPLRADQHQDGFIAAPTPAEPATASLAPSLEELGRAADERTATGRPTPRERPRLTPGDFLSEAGRLRVHGGLSVTVGTGSGGSFHGSSAWVSYHDTVTGISLGLAFSQMSGGGLYGYPGYDYYRPRHAAPLFPHPESYRLVPAGDR